ncbi:ABC transporter permease [Crossiella cryophila]|uniref:ABC-2 type transport system permease protein n=1 Tax=Crossiella cryophila TaxID=43355 RepID=A0A7W7FZT6_9PSEU|nr:ABC transporter permease [Crossiella cryophila]MBB4681519.1 ABC-2 type transport system permease protein [Crossiella cryophila]
MTGAGLLFRLFLRRDRVLLPGWIGLITLLVIGTAVQYAGLFPTAELQRAFLTEVTGNAALSAFTGQAHGSGLPALTGWKISDIAYALTSLMAILITVRHTRAEEESGRAELLGAGVLGRHAVLAAALALTWTAALGAGLLIAVGLLVLGFALVNAVAFGIAVAAPGLVFGALAGLTAQLTPRARTATALAATGFGLAYLLRFLADGSGVLWLRWLSPTGWSHLLQPTGDPRWAVLLLPLTTTALLTALAANLVSRRDHGAGVLATRTGPAVAAPGLSSAFGLAWRLHRGQLLGWTAGFAVAGAATAAVAKGMPEIAGRGGPAIREFFRRYAAGPEAGIADTYLWLIMLSLGGVAALYPMLVTLRLRAEETDGRAELTLSTTVGRTRWALSHLAFALLGTASMLLSGGLTAATVHTLSTSDGAQFGRVLLGALVQVPAAWTIGAVAVLAFGFLPRAAAAISWTVWLLTNLVGEQLGPVLGVDYWLANQIVPFHHIPKVLSGGEFATIPLLALTAVTLLLAGTGLFGLRRRDLG